MKHVADATQRNVTVRSGNRLASGVIIQDNIVLANFHALATDSNITVNGNEAKIIAVDLENDLILLKTSTRNTKKLVLNDKVGVGEQVFYVANTNGHADFVSFGRVNFIERFIYTDTVPIGGCSGGGLYNLAGELVGINVGHELNRIGLHIKASVVKDFLSEHKDKLK